MASPSRCPTHAAIAAFSAQLILNLLGQNISNAQTVAQDKEALLVINGDPSWDASTSPCGEGWHTWEQGWRGVRCECGIPGTTNSCSDPRVTRISSFYWANDFTGSLDLLSPLTGLEDVALYWEHCSTMTGTFSSLAPLVSLTYLTLTGCHTFSDSLANAQASLPNAALASLVLSNTNTTGDIAALRMMVNLETLRLGDATTRSSTIHGDIAALSDMATLRDLTLYGPVTGDIASLSRMACPTAGTVPCLLSLVRTDVTGDIAALEGLRFTDLYLQGSLVHGDAAQLIAANPSIPSDWSGFTTCTYGPCPCRRVIDSRDPSSSTCEARGCSAADIALISAVTSVDQMGSLAENRDVTETCMPCVAYMFDEGRGGETSERWPTAAFPAFIADVLEACSPDVPLPEGCAMDAAGDGNGVVDTSDLLVLLASFGLRC